MTRMTFKEAWKYFKDHLADRLPEDVRHEYDNIEIRLERDWIGYAGAFLCGACCMGFAWMWFR